MYDGHCARGLGGTDEMENIGHQHALQNGLLMLATLMQGMSIELYHFSDSRWLASILNRDSQPLLSYLLYLLYILEIYILLKREAGTTRNKRET